MNKQKTENRITFVIPADLRDAVSQCVEHENIRQSELIREALTDYLVQRGYSVQSPTRLPMGGKRTPSQLRRAPIPDNNPVEDAHAESERIASPEPIT